MQTGPISQTQSPQQGQPIEGYAYVHQFLKRAAAADPNGPYGKLLAEGDKAINWLLSQKSSNKQTSDPRFMAAQQPMPFSGDQISPDVQQNPNAYLQDGSGNQYSARIAPNSTDSSGNVGDGDHGSVVNLDNSSAAASPEFSSRVAYDDPYDNSSEDSGPVNADSNPIDPRDGEDNSPIPSSSDDNSSDDPGQVEAGSDNGGDPVNTDPSQNGGPGNTQTTGGQGTPTEGTTSSTLNEAPPTDTPLPPPILDGTAFTTADELTQINDLKAQVDAAEQDAIAHPNDAVKAQKAQDLLEQYQLAVATARQNSQMMAQQEMDALKAAQLH
jgi:hypothetical protein